VNRRLGVAVAGTVALVVAAGTGVGWAATHRTAATRPATVAVHTTAVVRTDLSDVREFAGDLGYGPEQPVKGRAAGTVTWLPDPGTTVDRGQPLFGVDARPVSLFFGSTPLFRKLDRPGLKGPDVAVVKANLTALGHGAGGGAADELTAGTVEAVKRWQRATEQADTGIVDVGDVVVRPGPVRVATVRTQLAGAADGDLMTVTGTGRAVNVAVDANRLDALTAGDPVTVVLPSGATAPGKVAAVGGSVPAGGGGEPGGKSDGGGDPTKVNVTVGLDDPAALGKLSSGPVQVRFVGTVHKAVLAVPLTALVALSEGGYAVEVEDNGRRSLIAVRTGLFARGLAEVDGPGLREGQRVVVTS
jgi:hypothetical protein